MGIKHSYLASEEIVNYICSVSPREHPVLERCRRETSSHPQWNMQMSAEQAPLFRILLSLVQAKKTLEIGVFTGFSSTLTALHLPPGGRVVACDISEEFTRDAKRYWNEAGVADKVELRLGPAAETLDGLIAEGQSGTFDFAFIDADKAAYDIYYEGSLRLLRSGGLILLDNMLRGGKVLDQQATDPDVTAIQALNHKLATDDRVLPCLLPITDGMTLVWKK